MQFQYLAKFAGLGLSLVALLICSTATHAELIDNGDGTVTDTDTNLMWTKDGNLTASNSFGLSYSTILPPHPSDINQNAGAIYPKGHSHWGAALHWVDAMNLANFAGYNDWRLPGVIQEPGGCFPADTGSNCGENVLVENSELAYLFHISLGNQSVHDELGNIRPCHSVVPPAETCSDNSGPFINVNGITNGSLSNGPDGTGWYWTGTRYDINPAVVFAFLFNGGVQALHAKLYNATPITLGGSGGFYAWPVRSCGPEGCPGTSSDSDGDGVPDDLDVCEGSDDNVDTDADGVPDGCDACPIDAQNDADGDGVCGDIDVCPNADDNADIDLDGAPDACDVCPIDFFNDADDDGFCADVDNCPTISNSTQSDNDMDGVGDDCDSDDDNDGYDDDQDNCPFVANDQADFDADGAGDVCDADEDGDEVVDNLDACLLTPVGETVNEGGCSISQLCPCDNNWKNHGAYVRCVAHNSEDYLAASLITEAEKDAVVSAAGTSSCGKKK